jgi:hypothetical protein
MSDPRFARFKTDPRFRKPRKKSNKVVVDDRFKSIFDDDEGEKRKGTAKRTRNFYVMVISLSLFLFII